MKTGLDNILKRRIIIIITIINKYQNTLKFYIQVIHKHAYII
jgi:hypothetical protein